MEKPTDPVQGTLDLVILKTTSLEPKLRIDPMRALRSNQSKVEP